MTNPINHPSPESLRPLGPRLHPRSQAPAWELHFSCRGGPMCLPCLMPLDYWRLLNPRYPLVQSLVPRLQLGNAPSPPQLGLGTTSKTVFPPVVLCLFPLGTTPATLRVSGGTGPDIGGPAAFESGIRAVHRRHNCGKESLERGKGALEQEMIVTRYRYVTGQCPAIFSYLFLRTREKLISQGC